jgi:hypothetical protein
VALPTPVEVVPAVAASEAREAIEPILPTAPIAALAPTAAIAPIEAIDAIDAIAASGRKAAISTALSERTLHTSRGARRAVPSQPRSRNADRIQQPSVRRAACIDP